MSSFKGKYWAPSYTEQMADNGFCVEQYKAPLASKSLHVKEKR